MPQHDTQPTPQSKLGTKSDKRENDKGSPPKVGFENEGEGNKTAARNYDAATEEYIHAGKVEPAAQEAKRAIDGPEGDELRAAEKRGREEGEDAASLADTAKLGPKHAKR